MAIDFEFDVYMLCPVRKATDEEIITLLGHKEKLEARGLRVHYAAETPQEDKTGGYRICKDHSNEIFTARAAHAYWNGKSTGSYVDLGTILGEHFKRGMDLLLINRPMVEEMVEKQRAQGLTKSYEMVLLTLDDMADPYTRVK